MSVFDDALTAGIGTIRIVCGVAVIYRRGNRVAQITATRGRTECVADGAPALVRAALTDWIIARDALDFGDGAFEPVVGDEIVETRANGSIHTFEVVSLDDEGCSREHDPGGTTLRVHSQLCAMQ